MQNGRELLGAEKRVRKWRKECRQIEREERERESRARGKRKVEERGREREENNATLPVRYKETIQHGLFYPRPHSP